MKIHPLVAELFHVYGLLERLVGANSCFLQFHEHAKKKIKFTVEQAVDGVVVNVMP